MAFHLSTSSTPFIRSFSSIHLKMAQLPLTPNASAVWAICEELRVQMLDAQLNALFGAELWAVLALDVGVMALCCWALCRHTPPEMAAYRWHLANVAASSFLFETTGLLILKQCYQISAEILILHAIGPLALPGIAFNVGVYLFIELMFAFYASVVFALAYRFAAITDRTEQLNSKRAVCLLALWQLLSGLPVAIFYLVFSRGTSSEVKEFEACFANDEGVSVLFLGNYTFMTSVFGALVFLLPSLVLIAKTLLALKRKRALISLDTYRYQKQLTTALLVQICVPSIFYYGIALTSLAVPNDKTMAAFVRALVVLAYAHTSINGLLMLAMVRPYREAVRQKWAQFKKALKRGAVEPLNGNN